MKVTERIDAITHIPVDYRKEELPAPPSVKIELTGKCNHKCRFCGTGTGLRDVGNMEWELYTRLVQEMVDAGVKELGMFYLGESFLYPRLTDAIKFAKDTGIEYCFITTNGTAIKERQISDAMKAGLNSLKWSFNYASPEQFSQITRTKEKLFHFLIKNMRKAHEIRENGGYDCKLTASYIRYDEYQKSRMKPILREVEPYVDEIYQLPLYSQASLITKKDFGTAFDAEVTQGNRGRIGALVDSLPCWACFTEGHITFDGMLSACCFGHEEKFTMADLNTVSFMEGWNSETFQNLRRAHLAKDVTGTPCEKCLAF